MNIIIKKAQTLLCQKEAQGETLPLPYVFLKLHMANTLGEKDMQTECLKTLMCSKVILDQINLICSRNYRYYGCEQLAFLYENVSKEEFMVAVWETIREHLKKFRFDSKYGFPLNSDGDFDLSEETATNRIKGGITTVGKWAFRLLLVEKAHEHGFVRLNTTTLSDYAMIRKVCNYDIELNRNSNKEILLSYASHWKTNKKATIDDKLSMGSKDLTNTVLERVRRGFSFIDFEEKPIITPDLFVEKDVIKKAFDLLSETEKEIISLRFENQKNFAEIGKILSMSADQARYKNKVALEKIRKELSY